MKAFSAKKIKPKKLRFPYSPLGENCGEKTPPGLLRKRLGFGREAAVGALQRAVRQLEADSGMCPASLRPQATAMLKALRAFQRQFAGFYELATASKAE